MPLYCLSSFEKVFYHGPTTTVESKSGSALLGEKYAMQFVFSGEADYDYVIKSPQGLSVAVFEVKQIPSMTPVKDDYDQQIITGIPGFFPDLLEPIGEVGKLSGTPHQWHSIWVEVWADTFAEQEVMSTCLELHSAKEHWSSTFDLTILPVQLPTQQLIHTEWFHTDCLVSHYGGEVFDSAYWQLVEAYVKCAVEHGQNMLLTPLFTPPLDMDVGKERLTVQLVGVEVINQRYYFDFSLLDKWSTLCRKVGITYLEFSHLYTQWGATSAPKIMGTVQGQLVSLFGWQTEAKGKDYQDFLLQFLPALLNWIEDNNWQKNVYFHISDEPSLENLAHYRDISGFLKDQLKGYPIIDALSNYAFFQEGLVDIPVVANDHLMPFLRDQVTPLWTYYCNAQKIAVSNRFFDMPSARNRIIGYQLFKYQIQGFLHWGYNFWYTQYSRQKIDPFMISDAGGAFPSGDAYLVYPGETGPLPSLRLKVLHYAIQDLRACELLATYVGRERVLDLLKQEAPGLTFSDYPQDASWHLSFREKINANIKKIIN